MRASVIIPTYRRPDALLRTVRSLGQQSGDGPYELIVVLQPEPSNGALLRQIRGLALPCPVRVLLSRPPSLPRARNSALRAASGEVMIFLDDDVLVCEGLVAGHLAQYADPGVGAVAGRVLPPVGGVNGAAPAAPIGQVQPDGAFLSNFDACRAGEVDFGMGCNMSFRRTALLRAGLFDERYSGNYYREEGDTFFRIKQLGYRVVFAPRACVIHLEDPRGGCRSLRSAAHHHYHQFRNETLYFANCRSPGNLRRFLPRMLRWIYATMRTRAYPWPVALFFVLALVNGYLAHLRGRPVER